MILKNKNCPNIIKIIRIIYIYYYYYYFLVSIWSSWFKYEINSLIYIYILLCGPILPCIPTVCEEGPSPISRVRGDEYPRTSSRGMDQVAIRGEVGHVCKELGRVRGWWSSRYLCPRCLVNLLITQNNA